MPQKKDLNLLISRIKAATGLNQEEIAKDIHYSRSHFSTLKSQNSEELYVLLEKHFEEDLQTRNLFNEEGIELVKNTKHINAERALIDMLILEVAKLKSKLYGVSVEDAISELEQNAILVLRQFEKHSG